MAYGKIKADTIIYDNSGTDVEVTTESITSKANLADPTFTGTVTVPTPAASDNTTKAATTAWVQTELGDYVTSASPALTGNATAVNLTLSGDLTVGGTTTTVNSATLEVTDKNIEIGKVSTPTDVTADGGGITLKGTTDKTITWTDATDTWDFNQDVKIINDTNVGITFTHQGATAEIQFTANSVDEAGEIRVGESTGGGVMQFKTKTTGGTLTQALQLGTDQNATFAGTITDSKGELRAIPQNTQGSAYTLVASDHGKHILASGAITVPDNVFTAGQAVTIVNNTSGNITINKGTTMYWVVDGSDGNRTLGTRGVATLLVASGTVTYLTGAGLS